MRGPDVLDRILERQTVAFVAAALIASLLGLIVATHLGSQYPTAVSILTNMSSAVLGATIAMLFAAIFDAGNMYRIRQLLQGMQPQIYSEEDKLRPYRRKWHHYFATVSNGKLIWRHRHYHFDTNRVPGCLAYAITVDNPGGGAGQVYSIEGFLVGARLILVQRPQQGTEPAVIQIFPHGGEAFRATIAGVSFLRSWDGDNLVVPVMLSQVPLTEADIGEGTIPETELATIQEKWKELFLASDRFLISEIVAR